MEHCFFFFLFNNTAETFVAHVNPILRPELPRQLKLKLKGAV